MRVRRSPWSAFTASAAIALAALLCAAPARAQEGTLQGTVSNQTGAAVVSASVRVVGAESGAIVDANGHYTLRLAPGTYRIAARALGYRRMVKSVTIQAGQAQTLDFILQVSAVQLDEVVASVTAGQTSRREVGTDIATINAAQQVQEGAVTNFSQLLHARATNVTVTETSGAVGAGSRIRVRGINTLTGNNNPLLIIDGVRVDNETGLLGINRGQTFSRFNDINPQDIKSIEVVKGPSATALYGSEASPGVIIITTKSGSGQKTGMRATIGTEQGFQRDVTSYPTNYADVTPYVTGANDSKLSQWPVATNATTGQVFVTDNPFMDASTRPFRTGLQSGFFGNLRGSSDNFSYYTSARFDDDQGVMPSNYSHKLDFRANFQGRPSDILTEDISAGYTSSKTNLPKSGNNTSGYAANGFAGRPFSSLGTGGDCLATVLAGTDPSFCDKNGNVRAGFDKIKPILSLDNVERFTISSITTLTPVSWMVNTAKVGADITNETFQDAIPYDPDIPFSFAAGGQNFLTTPQTRTYTADLSTRLSYKLRDDLTAQTAGGAQYFQHRISTVSCQGYVFPNDKATACDAAVTGLGFSDFTEKVEIGAYLQQRFSYNDYLFVTGAMRVDDNSSLGSQQGAIWSPSANASFVVSDLPSWKVDFINELRLRAAWGEATQAPPQYAADRTYVTSALHGSTAGLSPQDPGNPDLGPERDKEFEAGFNAGLWDSRVGLDFTYYDRTSNDAIVPRSVAPSTGFPNVQYVNLGQIKNHGFEASLDAQLLQRDNLDWTARLQWSTTNSRVTKLGLSTPIFLGFSQVIAEGYAPGAYISRVITSAARDANGNIIPSSIQYAPGDLGDGSGRVVVGQPTPTNMESFQTTVRLLGHLTLSTLFDREAGHQVYSTEVAGRNPNNLGGINSSFGDMWAYRQTRSSPVQQAMMEQNELLGDHAGVFIYDANFIKWRELTLSYEVPERLTRKLGAATARLYGGARNLATITNFPGVDPEANQNGARDNLRVVEGNTFPAPLTFYGGLTLTF